MLFMNGACCNMLATRGADGFHRRRQRSSLFVIFQNDVRLPPTCRLFLLKYGNFCTEIILTS